MIRAIVADDEPMSRRVVEQLLARHSDVSVIASCADGDAAHDAITRLAPDVAFLDVRMPLRSGLEVAEGDGSRASALVVFVSAYEEFALPAFAVAAVDYLTKPLVEPRFDEAVERIRHRLGGGHVYPRHFVARVGTRDIVIPTDDVDYIAADDVYAAVVSRGKRFLVRASLDTLDRTLDPRLFCRVHRSYIVRRDRIMEVRRLAGGNAEVVIGGVALPVSRRRRASIAELLKPFAT
ncbi:MAG TPA: LytTR family DNA-binding domain-containing protein [Gemmatimonadaceae bacterium]|nr:LytTR family DNA-binding domain-containing protein [Gemmatimonadaceae bacterium]